jgi:acylphosphatase
VKAIRAVASGKVQGVGFRWFVREQARRVGVDGWVRNCPDGSVEVLAAGAPESVDALVRAVRRGPSAARVDVLNVLPAGGEVAPHPFTIR